MRKAEREFNTKLRGAAENERTMRTEEDPRPESTEKRIEATVESRLDILEDTQPEPIQVKSVMVVYVPFKDFEARVNQDTYYFRASIPLEIPRDLAADLLRDEKRG